MKKLLTAATANLFIFSSTFALAGEPSDADKSDADKAAAPVKPMSAQEILNRMACKDKKPGTEVKDQTSGKMIKCPEPDKDK